MIKQDKREKILRGLLRAAWIGLLVGALALCAYVSGDRNFGTYFYRGEGIIRDVPPKMPEHIALVGDLWTAGGELARQMESAFAQQGYQVRVNYLSWPQAHSGEIAAHLHEGTVAADGDITDALGSDVDTVLLLTGSNDVAQHMGADYYAVSVCKAVEVVATAGKLAVVVELPGKVEREDTGLMARAKRAVYCLLFDGGERDVVEKYRLALREELEESRLPCLIVPWDDAETDGGLAPVAENIAEQIVAARAL